jgi:predicted metal-dependent phosphoesterase TrpH
VQIEADLHLHSHHSDGVFPPARVVEQAAAAGLKAIALTDHDTVDGVEEALGAAPPGFEVIPGAEISSVYKGRDIHLLAYFVDHADARWRAFLEPFRGERRLRTERIVARLNRIGVGVTVDEIYGIACSTGAGQDVAIGRPHIADAIVRSGAARDIDDAFARYLRRGQPAYVPKPAVPIGEAVRLVRVLGGALVVAHPMLNLGEPDIETLASEGLDGIEVWHPKHTAEQRVRLERMTVRLGLVASGGSDYHGPGRNRHEIASAGVPIDTVESLRARARR